MGADLLRDQPAGALPKLAPKQELIEAQSVSRRCGPRFSKRRKQMTYSKILNHGCRIQLIPPLESFETDSGLPQSKPGENAESLSALRQFTPGLPTFVENEKKPTTRSASSATVKIFW